MIHNSWLNNKEIPYHIFSFLEREWIRSHVCIWRLETIHYSNHNNHRQSIIMCTQYLLYADVVDWHKELIFRLSIYQMSYKEEYSTGELGYFHDNRPHLDTCIQHKHIISIRKRWILLFMRAYTSMCICVCVNM